ncbi:hypothetical protein ACIBCN_24765 [Nocardia sp. NPDC051052]|uniref:hypothetical protein n=1 Tax=Nocardia sp. NPDC051052 TaxID=3364322 RepID=UPI0037B870CE
MNLLVTVGGAVLALGLLILIATVLRRPSRSPEQLTVAALKARLAEEHAPAEEAAERLVAPELEHASAQQAKES